MAEGSSLEATLRQHYQRLKADPEALPWRERRKLVGAVKERLASGRSGAVEMKLVHLLAGDTQGEVRTEVAELLAYLPEQEFVVLWAKLAEDDYAFARHAAERALARRRKGQDDQERRQRVLEDVAEEYARIFKKFGPEAAEMAREVAERLYETQVGGTVHTMRTILAPLQVHIGSVRAMKDKDGNAAARQEHLRKCAELAAKLEGHLESMREYARPVILERRAEKLAGILSDAEHRAREALKAEKRFPAGARVECDIPGAITVRAAREQMVVAFTNLIKNALEALPASGEKAKPGRVRISARQDDESVEITIEDTGAGLTAAEQEALRAFRPGQTTLKPYGTGWGMPLAHKTIRAHGGGLSLSSLVGEGTTVKVVLPIGTDDENT